MQMQKRIRTRRSEDPDELDEQDLRWPRAAGGARGKPVPDWRKSSHSGPNGNCVEIAWRQGASGLNIVVRDSKFPDQEPLVFTPGEWATFLVRVKSGDFDVLASPVVTS